MQSGCSSVEGAAGQSTDRLARAGSWGGFALLVLAVSATAQYSYLLFHSLVEVFRIVVVFGVAAIAWNARRQIDEPFLMATAMGYPAIGILELLHTLSYKGMGILGTDADLPTQFWIAFRGLESFVMLVGALWPARYRISPVGLATSFLAAGGLLVWLVLSGRFPACFIEGSGLTNFKIAAEYVIATVFGAALLALWRRSDFPRDVLPLVLLAIACDILAELAFTNYASVYGAANLAGHLLLLTSTYLLYRAILLQGIQKPQSLLFHHLQEQKELLAKSEAELAARVKERTTQLSEANLRLHEELAERKRIAEELAESEEMLRLTRNVALDAIVVMDQRGRIVTWNPAAAQLFGYAPEEVIGHELHAVLAPERHHAAARAGVERFGRSGTGPVIGKITEIAARRRDGTEIPVELSISAVKIRGAWHAAGIVRDVSERRAQQTRIARLVRVYQVLSGINSAIVRIHDRQAMLDEACRVAVEVGQFGMAWIGLLSSDGTTLRPVAGRGLDIAALEEAPITIGREVSAGHGTAHEALSSRRAAYCNALDPTVQLGPVRMLALKNGYRSVCALPLVVDGKSIGVMGLYAREAGFFDADEIKLLDELAADISFALQYIEREERLTYLAYYDALTGLPNRGLFLDRLNQFVHGAKAGKHGLATIVLDLDDFTRVNETQGRGAGDALLKAVAERLITAVREPCSLARVGADTFAIAVNGLQHGVQAATAVQDRIFEALGAPVEIDGIALHLAAHAGVALYPGDGDDGESLLQSAEAALREARSSTSRTLFYAPEINLRRAADLALESDLRNALATGQLVVHYQPRAELANGEIVGAEALIRWQHPARGLVPPAEFIPLAERTGLIVPIGAWVVDAVCAQQAAWLRAGLDIVPVAINLSPVQFTHDDLFPALQAPLAKYGLEAQYLELELTEGLVMRNPEAAVEIMRRLRECGFRLALDDFGTGYSSLAYLSRFPFDFVKIDRAFVRDITQNPGNAAIATAVIAMAHRLNLRVVAEGVESEGQLQYLRRHQCDQIQGFYLSRPLPAEGFADMLACAKGLSLATSAKGEQPTVLLVDDEPGVRAALHRTLRREGYRILTASSGQEGLELLAENRVQVIISDQRMPSMSGSQFLSIVKELYPDTVRIILSGYADLQAVIDAINRGAVYKFLTKPWDDALFKEHIRDAFLRYHPPAAPIGMPDGKAGLAD